MSASVAVQFDDSQLLSVLDGFASRGGNLRSAMKLVALDMGDRVEDNFAEERGFKQGPWEPLAPETIKRRRKEGRGHKILQDTGVMAASVVPDYGNDFAEVFTTIAYAKYHVSKAPRHKIPLRDFFDIDLEGAQEHAAKMILEEVI